jgi:hypothetical protein
MKKDDDELSKTTEVILILVLLGGLFWVASTILRGCGAIMVI